MDILDFIARLLGRPPAHEVVHHDLGWTPALRKPKRPPPADPSEAIAAFWTWWGEAASALDHLDTEPPSQEVLRGFDERLAALHRELAWEMGPGIEKKHALTVSPDGVSALRSLTAAWKAAAPVGYDDWEFHDARPAVVGSAVALELETAGTVVSGRDVEVAVFDDEQKHRLDVWVHHPEMGGMSRRNRWSLAFLLVDAALGEERVATWLRTITPSTRPLAEVPEIREHLVVRNLDGLRARVSLRELQGDAAPPPMGDTAPSLQVDPRARRWRFPAFDTWVRIEVESHKRVSLEQVLAGGDAQWVTAVRLQTPSRYRVDLYTADGAAVSAAIQAAVPGAVVESQRDPGWGLAGR
ncbi:MAG TPA: hypothetical protein DFR83_15070 [Deltaproteobacteria bacterium]|nr:hypothetical protein [Deltaproteobacteria bacterium]